MLPVMPKSRQMQTPFSVIFMPNHANHANHAKQRKACMCFDWNDSYLSTCLCIWLKREKLRKNTQPKILPINTQSNTCINASKRKGGRKRKKGRKRGKKSKRDRNVPFRNTYSDPCAPLGTELRLQTTSGTSSAVYRQPVATSLGNIFWTHHNHKRVAPTPGPPCPP